ncbi:MAG: DUF4139 domain-containing protein [Acidobacteriaceae bacterium]|jgi:hypothetical protein
MRKAIGIPTLFLAIILLAITPAANAQQPSPVKPALKAAPRPAAHTEAPASSQLPVTRVSLYKNGVGFFEHSGRVSGDQSVTIDFTTAQLNDVLQSLTAIDLNGGRIAGAGYNSTTPLEQQLKALPLALGEDPTAVDFYNAIRGARVEVQGPGATISGRLLNIEVVDTSAANNQPASEKRLITVIGEAGEIRTLELTPATEVRLLDADLHTDVTRYLQLLASTRNQGLRHLTLQDNAPANGAGARELHVSYISEVPIWKSTYRILFTEPKSGADPTKQTATLQGWSVVDNTTGADWINVQLSLIAGAPQSFIQPLSVPYYSRRPEIGLPQEAQLTPQTHESGESAPPLPPPPAAPMRGTAMGYGGGAGMGGAVGGIYAGTGQQTNMNENFIEGVPVDSLAQSGSSGPISYQARAANSVVPNTTTAAFDDYFAYNLSEPITIRKNESALVPILQTKIDAERVTLWSVRQPTPLRALWITNTSNLTLDRGSFSIVEDGNFGGEGLLDPIHPSEKRLLSYAVDEAVHVTNDSTTNHLLRSVVIAKGILTEHYRDIVTRDYAIRNAATEPRTVVLEHSRLNDYQLNAESTAKPDETTPTLYRFRVAVPSGQTVHFKVAESHAYPRTVQVGNINDQQIKVLLQEMGEKPEDNPDFLKQLQPVLDAQRKVADLNAQKRAVDTDIKGLHDEEERQRANITALKDADKQAQLRFVNDLSHTEDQIAQKQKDQQALDTEARAAQQALADLVQHIDFDQKLSD